MYIVLEPKDYTEIANAIVDSKKDYGTICVEIDGLELDVSFEIESYGHTEYHYKSFVSEFVYDSVDITITSISYMDIDIRYDESKIEEILKEIITL